MQITLFTSQPASVSLLLFLHKSNFSLNVIEVPHHILSITSTSFLTRCCLVSFVQVRKRVPGLEAQAGPRISTAGRGSDRPDGHPIQQNHQKRKREDKMLLGLFL